MAENERDFKKKIEELDDFWDLEELLPERSRILADRPSVSPRTVEIKSGEEDTVIRRFVLPPRAEALPENAPETVYAPSASLLHEVRVFPWRSSYGYFETFYRDVERYTDVHIASAPPVKFFSYVPQYSQMNKAQLAFYFFFRDRVRAGEYPTVDYSYILLFIFEILNRTKAGDPKGEQELLCRLWRTYRKTYPQLDKVLGDWICDYGLIHRLPPPVEALGDDLSSILEITSLKEYYIVRPAQTDDAFLSVVRKYCNSYDYTKSHYYEAHRELYDRVMREVLRTVLDRGGDGAFLSGFSVGDSTLTRDSYVGALCSYHAKKKIVVSYSSFSRTNEFRYIVGDVLKYAENGIRAYLSIKSRLGVFSVREEIRGIVDVCLSRLLVGRAPTKDEAAAAVYEKYYDLPKKEFSLRDASRIEEESWDTTKKLIDAFTDETPAVPDAPPKPEETPDDPFSRYRDFIAAALRGDVAAERLLAQRAGKTADAIADELNAAAFDAFSDIFLEETDGGYTVIADYRDEWEEKIHDDQR